MNNLKSISKFGFRSEKKLLHRPPNLKNDGIIKLRLKGSHKKLDFCHFVYDPGFKILENKKYYYIRKINRKD